MAYPAGEAGEVVREFDAAARAVLGDPSVWAEEAERPSLAPLPWPLRRGGQGYGQLLRYLCELLVEDVLATMREAGREPPPEDVGHPEFQWVLRVVKRAADAGDAALVAKFGGTGRLSIKRDLDNFVKRLRAEEAVRSGLPRGEAFSRLGLSRAGAYRALGRPRK